MDSMKGKDSFLTKYQEEKKTLLTARDVLIAIITKMTDRFDALHYGSFTAMTLLLAFNAFFNVHELPPGETIKVRELFRRLLLLFSILSVALSFLWLMWDTKMNISEEINDSDEQFEDLSVWFDGLSKKRDVRDAERSASPNLQPDADNLEDPSVLLQKLELFYPYADKYDNLKPEELIPSSEVRIFNTRGKNESIALV